MAEEGLIKWFALDNDIAKKLIKPHIYIYIYILSVSNPVTRLIYIQYIYIFPCPSGLRCGDLKVRERWSLVRNPPGHLNMSCQIVDYTQALLVLT